MAFRPAFRNPHICVTGFGLNSQNSPSHNVGSTTLLQGATTIWKNKMIAGRFQTTLSYDNELEFFKVISAGRILTSFRPLQVMGTAYSTSGAVRKSHKVTVHVKFPNGDEYAFMYRAPNAATAREVRGRIQRAAVDGKGKAEVLRLLKTREKVPVSEVSALLTKCGLPSSPADSQRLVETMISSGIVEGVFDGKDFKSHYALQKESVRYNIVAKFEVGKNGVVVLSCPNCGASIALEQKESTGKCEFCGTAYTIPRKILDLM